MTTPGKSLFGKVSNREPEYLEGSAGDDDIWPGGGWDIVDGGAGEDTVWVVGPRRGFDLIFEPDIVYLDVVSGASAYANRVQLKNVEWIQFSDERVSLSQGRDFWAQAGDERFEGGVGVDTLTWPGGRADYEIRKSGAWHFVRDREGDGGLDRVTAIERLHFRDERLALDVDGAAGTVARIITTVFGVRDFEASQSKRYMGIGLDYLERLKFSPEALADLAVQARLGAEYRDPATVVDLLFSNLFDRSPSMNEAQPYVSGLQSGAYSVGSLALMASQTPLAADRIDLVGLAETGIGFVLP